MELKPLPPLVLIVAHLDISKRLASRGVSLRKNGIILDIDLASDKTGTAIRVCQTTLVVHDQSSVEQVALWIGAGLSDVDTFPNMGIELRQLVNNRFVDLRFRERLTGAIV